MVIIWTNYDGQESLDDDMTTVSWKSVHAVQERKRFWSSLSHMSNRREINRVLNGISDQVRHKFDRAVQPQIGCKVNLWSSFEQIMMGRSHRWDIPSFVEISPPKFRRGRFLKGFYHIWTWRPSWLWDHHHVNKFSFPSSWKLTYKIWLWLAKWFLRKAGFNFQM